MHSYGKKNISVLLVEEHQIVRKGLRALIELEDDICVVSEAENAFAAIELARQTDPMVVLMDVAMPRFGGLEAARSILKMKTKTKVVILSDHADDQCIERVEALGASGCLVKQCSPNILIEAIHSVSRKSTHIK